jgi:hypothetical protein
MKKKPEVENLVTRSLESLFEYGLELAKIFDFEIADFGLRCVNDRKRSLDNPYIFMCDCYS